MHNSGLHCYSQRLPWSTPANTLSTLATHKRREGSRLADLTISNPTAAGLSYPHAAIAAALGRRSDFSYHPDPFGLESARAAIVEYYAKRGYAGLDASRIALTASTSEAYSLLFKLLCDPGDEILIPQPSYPLFEHLASLENVRTVPYRLLYDGSWFIDFEELRTRISNRTRAIVLVNPNNPTGSFLKADEWARLVQVAENHQLTLVSDEVFMEYELAPAAGRVKSLVGEQAEVLSFSLNGLSKAAGMPQLKLAWIAINGPAAERERARLRLELLLDTYLSVNTPVQLALAELLASGAPLRSEIRARVLRNYGECLRVVKNSPVHVLHVEGGWSAIMQLPRTRSEEEWLLDLLESRNVLLQPGFFFDMPGEAFAVASLITEPETFSGGIQHLRELVDSHA